MTRTALFLAACTLVLSGSVCRADDPKANKEKEAPNTGEVVPACHKKAAACADGICPVKAPCADCGLECADCDKGKDCYQGDRGHLLHKKSKCQNCPKCAGPAPCATCGDCGGCGEKKSCVKKLCGWLFYCKHTPKSACGCHCCACCCGPLYQYFLCTPIPTAHIGDGYYIGQYPSRSENDYMPAVVLPPPCHCPVCPPPQALSIQPLIDAQTGPGHCSPR